MCQATIGTIRILLLECTSYGEIKIYYFISARINSFRDQDFSKSGTGIQNREGILPDRSTNSRYFFTRNILDEIPIHLPNATISITLEQIRPLQLKMHRKYTLWTNDARGQRETISSAPEIPASLPHYGSIVGYNRCFEPILVLP